MNCLAVAGLVLRLASAEHGSAPAALLQSECGIEAGVARERGAWAAEAGLRVAAPGSPFFLRAGVQAARVRPAFPAPVIVPHGPGIHRQVHSLHLVPLGKPGRRWVLRERLTAGAALPLAAGHAVLFEIDPRRGDALLSLRISFKGGK